MEDEPADPIPPELQVWVDTEVFLEGTYSPVDHQRLGSALEDLPGIGSLAFMEDRIAIRHDPERITTARLCELIGQAGFRVREVENASSDPLDDLPKTGPPPGQPGG